MKRNTFTPALPQTGSYTVLQVSSSTVFASPNIVITVEDPIGTLATALTLVPSHISTVSFTASDGRYEYRYKDAALLIQEIDADGTLTMFWSAVPGDFQKTPLAARAA